MLKGEEKQPPNPYAGMPLDQIIAAVSTPEEAQAFCRGAITYANEDIGNRYKTRNGARDQSLAKTFARGRGICGDASIAAAALLQDDGYQAKILDVFWQGDGHSVFVYEVNSKFGTVGINDFDYQPPIYDSLDALATKVARDFGQTAKDYFVYDLTPLELVQGTNEGLVCKVPFVIYWNNQQNHPDIVIGAVQGGIGVTKFYNWADQGIQFDKIETIVYTPDVWEESIVSDITGSNGSNSHEEQHFVRRNAERLVERSEYNVTRTAADGTVNLFNGSTDIKYYETGLTSQQLFEQYQNQKLDRYRQVNYLYHHNGIMKQVEIQESCDGDKIFDSHEFIEFDEHGRVIRSWIVP